MRATYVALISTYVDIGFTCLVFKTTCVDRRKPLQEGACLFARRTLFPPQDKRNTRDKAKSLCISSERDIGELDVRCLSTINRGQHSRQQSHIGHWANLYRSRSEAVLVSPATNIGCLSLLYGWVFSLRTRTWGNLARRRVVITIVRGHSSRP